MTSSCFKTMKFMNRIHFISLYSYCSQAEIRRPLIQKSYFKSNNREDIIKHLCRENKFKEAIDILCEQKRLKEAVEILKCISKPPALVYSTLIQFCCQNRDLEAGKRVHEHLKVSGFVPGLIICNRLVDMYIKCGCLVDAQKLFDEMTQRDLCSWNTMISGYTKHGRIEEARKMFDEMPERDNFSWTAMISGYVRCDMPKDALDIFKNMQGFENSKSNKFTMSSVLAAAAAIPCLKYGKEIHGHITCTGLDSDEVVWSALSDMYGKCGSIEEARCIFDKMVNRDVVTWTMMIDRYFRDYKIEEGFELFTQLMRSDMKPNEFTFSGILNACADNASEEVGRQIHGYMTRIGFDLSSFAGSALVHMYSKCGSIETARHVFTQMSKPDLVSWTSLITGCAQHGQPNEALELFEQLLDSGIKPDHITFVGVLTACTHAGLVNKGTEYFHSIKEIHGLAHTSDHYACVVDLLARAGRFSEAEDIISKMPMKPNRFLWASLLGGCRTHGNLELSRRAGNALLEIEPENPATYVTMANIYASSGKWDEVAKIRSVMDEKGVVKKPGLSWTKIKRERHVFLVGDTSHPKSKEIYEFLGEISRKMKDEGFVPDTNFVLHDVEEEQKEQNLSYHSEKLAVSFAVISTPPGMTIKVFKNLRTCVDCHSAIKFISRIVDRKIIVRDSNRFHCFEKGNCLCRDYW